MKVDCISLYILLFVCITFSQILRSAVGLFDNCATRSDVPCRIHSYHGWQCISRMFENDFPELYQESLQCRSPKLNVSVVQKEIDGRTEQGIQLLWSPYTQVGIHFIKGFEIAVSGLSGNAIGMHRCFVADLSNERLNGMVDTDKKEIIFRHVIWSVPSDSTFIIRVTSLPGIDDDAVDTGSTAQVHLVSPEIKNHLASSADWQTSVNCVINSSSVLVKFNLPPKSYGFLYVKVDLLLKEKEMVLVRSNITNTDAVLFDSVSSGEYTVWVQPWDPHPFDPEKCLCRNFERLCEACRISTDQPCVVEQLSTSTITPKVSNRSIMTPSAQSLESSDIKKIVVISAKATLLVVIITVIISIVMCRYPRVCNADTGKNKNKQSEEQNLNSRDKDPSKQDSETLYCSPVRGDCAPSGSKSQFGDIRYDFIGPDSDSAFYDRTSKSISEQMLRINERYFIDNCSSDKFKNSSISLGGQSV